MKWKNQKLNQLSQELAVQMNRNASLTLWGKTWSFRPFRLGAAVLAGLVALVILVNLMLIPARRPRSIAMDFEAGGSYTMTPMGKHVLMHNKQHARLVNTKGKTLWSVEFAMSHPLVETAKQYMLLADLGGNNAAALYQKGEQLREFQLGNDIISADVNAKGMCAFATATVGYKGKVTVFDKKGRERFSWNSGDGYIMDIALSDNGRYLAVAQMNSDGAQADSRVQFIDLHRKKVTATAERNGTLISELRFSGERLLAVSDSELCGFRASGKLSYAVSFAGKNPSKYDITSDALLAFVTTDNRGNAVLELYTTGGKLRGRYEADSRINNLSVFADMTILANQREILYINRRGKLKKTVVSDTDIKSLGLYGDGHSAIAAGNTSAYIVRMR